MERGVATLRPVKPSWEREREGSSQLSAASGANREPRSPNVELIESQSVGERGAVKGFRVTTPPPQSRHHFLAPQYRNNSQHL